MGLMLGFVFRRTSTRRTFPQSITEFWRRWHISLSTWLRDYLYIPLGGNRIGGRRERTSTLFLVMFLGGLWHGADWTFVVWGAINGALLAFERLRAKHRSAGRQCATPPTRSAPRG